MMIHLLIMVLIVAAVCGLIVFLINRAPFIPAEWKAIGGYIVLFVFVIWIITLLLPMAGVIK